MRGVQLAEPRVPSAKERADNDCLRQHACLLQGEERKPPIRLSSVTTVVSVEPAKTGSWDPDQLTHWLRQLGTWFRAGDFTAGAVWRALGTCPATVLSSTASLQRTFIELLRPYGDVHDSWDGPEAVDTAAQQLQKVGFALPQALWKAETRHATRGHTSLGHFCFIAPREFSANSGCGRGAEGFVGLLAGAFCRPRPQ